MTSPTEPRECREVGCDTQIILARLPGSGTPARWVPLEARTRDTDTAEAAGCVALMGGIAWRPAELVEHLMTRFEIPEPRARERVSEYPHHRPHSHQL